MALIGKNTISLGPEGEVEIDVHDGAHPDSVYFRVKRGARGFEVSKADLYAAAFAMADERMQEQLMPVRRVNMVTYRRIHRVRVTKPLKAGDTLNVKCAINVEQSIHESLAGIFESKKPPRGKGILIPSP